MPSTFYVPALLSSTFHIASSQKFHGFPISHIYPGRLLIYHHIIVTIFRLVLVRCPVNLCFHIYPLHNHEPILPPPLYNISYQVPLIASSSNPTIPPQITPYTQRTNIFPILPPPLPISISILSSPRQLQDLSPPPGSYKLSAPPHSSTNGRSGVDPRRNYKVGEDHTLNDGYPSQPGGRYRNQLLRELVLRKPKGQSSRVPGSIAMNRST